MKKYIVILIVIIAAAGIYFFTRGSSSNIEVNQGENLTPTANGEVDIDTARREPDEADKIGEKETVLGKSVQEREIIAYNYGDGDRKLLFIGGIHGGYSWNTALVAYELMDYLEKNPNAVPDNIKVTVVPVLNPDGLNKIVGTSGVFAKADVKLSGEATVPGRFNANNVDLNRNFDCDWQSEGVWQSQSVDGGSQPFSEPESQAIKNYIETNEPNAVVVWYSAAGGVYASSCHNDVLPETDTILNTYSKASGYKAYKNFDYYAITGDMVNWLAKNNIPAISVLLTTHADTEWSKNRAGVDALMKYYAEKASE